MLQTESKNHAPVQAPLEKNICLVASGKGGVGKTWFSITLCQALAQSGKKVLLFDGDLGLANVDIQLGLVPKRDLSTFIEGKCTFEEAISTYADGGFDVLPGKSGSGNLSSLSPQTLSLVKEEIRTHSQKYDQIIVDLGAGVGGTVKGLSQVASRCLLVVTDEPTSLTDGYAFIKVILYLYPWMTIEIIVNNSENPKMGQKTYDTMVRACENFLKFKPGLAGIIRRDLKIPESIRHQKPLLTRYPNSDAAEDVREISKKI
ncbi:MinD/ParA family protein [Candidatus Bealeia paramacronuclearis]|uniref:MinD/ParA family protein n=1 Tax=Candidatus Bealeia paramacronuclearis TaxID=1921001 RepID=A0ABZ2C3U7_9PROT|nr:MinD/ParA family protein [Candidatus Bealeia paramacronuclearis]